MKVVIETAANGIIDVSEDIQNGSLRITENQSASLSLSLLNHRRKYDGIFTPNDLISVQMKRFRWIPVFAGYLNQVPYFSVYPRNIELTASDTLKRLRYRLWDPGTSEATELLQTSAGSAGQSQIDGGIRDKIIKVLTDVADWPQRTIHIGRLPDDWSDKMETLREKLADHVAVDVSVLGSSGAAYGSNPAAAGTTTVTPDGPGTGALPSSRGRAEARTRGVGMMALTGESRLSPRDQWWCSMRWPYAGNSSGGSTPTSNINREQFSQAKNWWRNRKLLVVNPKNNRAVTLRAADWGPNAPSMKAAAMSGHALTTVLGATGDDLLEFRFAPEGADLGPTSLSGGTPTAAGSPAPTTTPQVVQGATGQRWTGANNLKPNVNGARSFIQANWNIAHGIGGYARRNVAGTNTPSDHASGLALDIMVCPGGQRATGVDEAKGNAIAMWYVQNPHVFGTKYVIWMDRINTGSGWRRYGHPGGSGNTLQHRDHVHVSFKNTGSTSAGAMGSGWPGGTPQDFGNNVTAGNGADANMGGSAGNLINAFNWHPRPDPASTILAGPRALMNDSALLDTLAVLCQASMRSFMAAPNGDFIAWFPDYFGTYGTAAKMTIKDIELARDGFTVTWSDELLITHQFTAGSATGYSQGGSPGGMVDAYRMFNTVGIASVEFPEIMEALFNVNPNDPRAKNFLDPEAILQRFGARVNYQPMGHISGPDAEFWYACHLFQKNWASQFTSRVSLTFMPEVWPGMLLHLETFGFQAYVQQVVHNFNFSDGGGFTTDVTIIAPSATGGGLYALPRANSNVVPEDNRVAGEHTYGWGRQRGQGRAGGVFE